MARARLPSSPLMMASLALVALLAWTANARPAYQSRLPNFGKVPNPNSPGSVCPGVGHVSCSGGGARNPFGIAFAGQGLQWTRALCEMDSDGDGQTNGQELGDPCCSWTPNSNVKLNLAVSHPGFASSKLDDVQACASNPAPASNATTVVGTAAEVVGGTPGPNLATVEIGAAPSASLATPEEGTAPGTSPSVAQDLLAAPEAFAGNTDENKIQRNHGIVMAFSWGLLIPAGSLAARYIPAFGKSMFYLHLVLQLSGIALTLAALIQILVMMRLDSDISGCKGMWGKFLPHDDGVCRFWMLKEGWQYDHGRVGVTVVILALLQPLNAAFRPKPGTTAFRRYWELFHTFLGKATIMLGIFNVFFGIYVYTELFGGDGGNWRPWIGLVVASVATINITQHVIDKYLRGVDTLAKETKVGNSSFESAKTAA